MSLITHSYHQEGAISMDLQKSKHECGMKNNEFLTVWGLTFFPFHNTTLCRASPLQCFHGPSN